MSHVLMKNVLMGTVLHEAHARVRSKAEPLREVLMSNVFDALPLVIYLVDWETRRITYFNHAADVFFGFSRPKMNPLKLKTIDATVHPDDRRAYREVLAQLQSFEGLDIRLKDRHQAWRWMYCRVIPLSRTSRGCPSHVLFCSQDMTQHKAVEEQLRQQCYLDALTGLYNRAYFEEESSRLEKGRDYPMGLMLMDVDDFKRVNDCFGHQRGDDLLRHLAHILKTVFREGDVVARIGGDEFAVLLPRTDGQTLKKIAARVRRAIHQYNAAHPDCPLYASIGAAHGQRGEKLRTLFRLADEAMYRDKRQRKT